MSQSSQELDRAFTEAKRLCYAGFDERTLLKKVTERVRRAVPFEAYCAHVNDPASGLITYAVPSDAAIEERAPTFLQRVYLEDEVTPFNWMAKNRLPAIALSEATGGKPERALRYRELLAPQGFRHELRGVFALEGKLWGCITTMREPSGPDFDIREVALFHRIAHILPRVSKRQRCAPTPLLSPLEIRLPVCWSSTTWGAWSNTPGQRNGGCETLGTLAPAGRKERTSRRLYYRWRARYDGR